MNIEDKLSNFLDLGGNLIEFPAKRKMKLYALIYIASKFESGKNYTEKEVNEIINNLTDFNDPATVRRELWGNGFLGRERDCSFYWLAEPQPTLEKLGLPLD